MHALGSESELDAAEQDLTLATIEAGPRTKVILHLDDAKSRDRLQHSFDRGE